MNNIKNVFTIKDLENLSGIKAHTIRIWEKRYNILEPLRTDTNIRYYDVANLQKILNISTLNSFGYKISSLAKIPDDKIPQLVKEVLSKKSLANHVVNNFKLAMMNFDQSLFLTTYESVLKDRTFGEIFHEYFIPLLAEIGMLWQTETITPSHEHFISYLIKQKLASETERISLKEPKDDRTYVLYLPEGEIHEIGLMFLNYELQLNGYKAIYLGESVPTANVNNMKNYFNNITYISYLTVAPEMKAVNDYVEELSRQLLNDATTKLLLFGRNTQFIHKETLGSNITIYNSISDFTETL
ncbi:MerR family transcriptional regulator [Flavobacterium album]|uniref:MerR family transcriptional regulator n=1 Tax=Flavobacterium album TaxID=2175091 RepID=A0A2S1QYD3_9FLAO|nr:MerR family transcriptional regulator [Flavobacterium album]AWH85384.1 MerR family transcriptional regulator [Flavobacterium album]